MAYAIVSGDILELSIRYTVAGQVNINTLHYRMLIPGNPITDGAAALAALLDSLALSDSFPLTRLKECLAASVTVNEIRVQLIHPTRRNFVSKSISSPGSVAEPVLPPSVSVCVSKLSELTGASNRGRIEVGGVPTTFVANGNVTADGNNAYNNLGLSIKAPLTIGGNVGVAEPIILRRSQPGQSAVVENWVVRQNTRAMSRRVVGRGI